MSKESLPSKNIALLDVPEVKNFKSRFQYNFWTSDEFENGMGSVPSSLITLPSITLDSNTVNKTRKLPRLIELSWNPITLNPPISDIISIRDNLSKLHSEETFVSNDYTAISYQDNQADNKLKFFLSRFFENVPESSQLKSPKEIVDVLKNLIPSDEITANFLLGIVGDLQRNGFAFPDQTLDFHQTEDLLSTNFLERIKKVVINTKLNNRVLVPIANSVRKDSIGIFADEFNATDFSNNIQHIQDNAIAINNANLLSSADYEFEILSYISYRPLLTNGFPPSVQTLGYIIEKKEIRSDGSEEIHPSIIIENPLIAITYDAQIKYGSVYFYKIRAAYLIEIHATDIRTNKNLLVSFLAGSKFSPSNQVNTIETQPPPPPADFEVNWDLNHNCARLTWALPNNPQQDIKYIQVFRRRSIQEPFQLLKMWDFNNTQTKVSLNEYPSPELFETVDNFIGIYLDREFTKDSTFIYAVACVDAHALCSNYSIQFQVTFNRFDNRMVKKLVSLSGAPRQYPNAQLQSDTFVDTLKTSGFSTLDIIFNPEYTSLINKGRNDLRLLKTDRQNGKYRIQLINIDLQSQKNIDITLEDRRPSKHLNEDSRIRKNSNQ